MDEVKRNEDGSIVCVEWFFVPGMEDCYREYTFKGDNLAILQRELKCRYPHMDIEQALSEMKEADFVAMCKNAKINYLYCEGVY